MSTVGLTSDVLLLLGALAAGFVAGYWVSKS